MPTRRQRPSACARRKAGFADSARKARSSGQTHRVALPQPLTRSFGHEIEGDPAVRAGRDRAEMRARMPAGPGCRRSAARARRPPAAVMPNLRSAAQRLDARDGRARPEAVVHGLAVEGHGHRDVAAAVQMDLDAGAAGMVAEQAALVDRLVAVFEVDQGLLAETVLLDDRELDGGEAVIRRRLRNARSRGFPRPGRRCRLKSWLHSLLGSGVRPLCRSPSLHQVIGKDGGTRKGGADFSGERQRPLGRRRADEEVRAARAGDGVDLGREVPGVDAGEHASASRRAGCRASRR